MTMTTPSTNKLLEEYIPEYIPHPHEEIKVPLGKKVQENSTTHTRAAAGFDSQDDLKPTGFVITRTEDTKYRLMEMMAASGKNRKEVAETLGMSYSWVVQVFKQRWFKDNVVAILKENGKDHVQAFLKAEGMPSLEVVRDIRDNEKEKGATRLAAANSILDRLLGKAPTKVEIDATVQISSVDAEAEVLLREARALDEKMRARGLDPLSLTMPN